MSVYRIVITMLGLSLPFAAGAECLRDPACLDRYLLNAGPGYYQDNRYHAYPDYYDPYYAYPWLVPGGRYLNDYAPTPDGDPYGPYRIDEPRPYYGYPYRY